MSEPLTPLKIEAAIQFYLSQITTLVTEYAEAADAKAIASSEYDLDRAKSRTAHRAFLTANELKITEGVVDDHAVIEVYEKLKEKNLTAAREEAVKLALRAAQAKLDGARSLGSQLNRALQ